MESDLEKHAPAVVAKRRRWSRDQKRHIVEQSLGPGNSVPAVAAQYGVSASQVYRWMRLEQAAAAQGGTTALIPIAVAGTNPARAERVTRAPAGQRAGRIELAVGHAHLLVDGAADLCSLRTVLDYLLR
ncbi:MAG: transposase [Bryobacteraceae bacterium]